MLNQSRRASPRPAAFRPQARPPSPRIARTKPARKTQLHTGDHHSYFYTIHRHRRVVPTSSSSAKGKRLSDKARNDPAW